MTREEKIKFAVDFFTEYRFDQLAKVAKSWYTLPIPDKDLDMMYESVQTLKLKFDRFVK